MTTPRDGGALPGRDELDAVCGALGLDASDARMLRSRSNAVFHLPAEAVVVRLCSATPVNEGRAARVVSLTRWIADRGGPALAPTAHAQPVRAAGTIATLWPFMASPNTPSTRDLADAVRQLHQLDAAGPPAPRVPEHEPLARLLEALDLDATRDAPVLSTDDRDWLLARAARLQRTYDVAVTPLGRGLVHADVQPDNLVQDDDGRWLLIDWDRVSRGPRELDLVLAVPDHFHDEDTDRAEFSAAYGYDITPWPGWTLIRDVTEMHSLASYVRRAATHGAAREELHRRVNSLRTGDRDVIWRSVAQWRTAPTRE